MFKKSSRNRNKENKHIKIPTSKKIADALDIPENIFVQTPQIDFNGNTEVVVDGVAGVLEYNEETIKLNTNKFIIKFTGRELQIQCMTEHSAIINGYIVSTEFINI